MNDYDLDVHCKLSLKATKVKHFSYGNDIKASLRVCQSRMKALHKTT